MSSALPLPLERLSVADVAASVGLHPFEVVRLLGHAGELPPALRFEPGDVARVRELSGVEAWWEPPVDLPIDDPERTLALLTGLARRLVERRVVAPVTTRADNLVRGLPPADARRLRRVINGLVRARMLVTQASWRGLLVSVEPTWEPIVVDIAKGGQLPRVLREAWA